jgi:HSP20 family protein
MSNLIRWEPMREVMTLREAMDHLFDDAFTRPVGMAGSSIPAIDLYQTNDAVVVKAALPGFKPDDVQISVTSDVLTLRGEYKQENGNGQNDAVYHVRERRYGSFERSLTLPTSVQTDKAKADFENGVLTIQLPKSEEVKPKSISIKAR